MQLRVISWNINGLRAVWKRGDFTWLTTESPDIICLQETKAEESQIPAEFNEAFKDYHSVFSSSRLRKGYSGVAVLSKKKPDKIEELGIEEFDIEGRTIAAYFGKTVIVNSYFPNGGQGEHRIDYKMRFYAAFLERMVALRDNGYRVIFCGDVNTAHTEIDLAHPKTNTGTTGFLPIERAWIDAVIDKEFVDVYRVLYPDTKEVYTWWNQKTFSRKKNVGWRIDYFFIDKKHMKDVTDCLVRSEVMGSDHCPIELILRS